MQLLLPKTAGIFIGSLAGVLLVPYSTYAKYLKWLTLSLFAYVGVEVERSGTIMEKNH